METFILQNNTLYKIKDIKKERLNKYTKSWVFITDYDKFTTKDKIKFIYKCNECGKLSKPIKNYRKILNKNKILCRTCCKIGRRNPFFGKHHTKNTIKIIKKKTQIASKKLWENEDYRKKVIKNTSKPRNNKFKKQQSIRIKNWYSSNPEQKQIRSIKMKKYWQDGLITPNKNSINRSAGEKELYKWLYDNLKNYIVEKKIVIKIKNKWYLPDILINNKIIVEYYGNYWHGNPMIYKSDDIIAYKSKACEIWLADNKRKLELEHNEYHVIIVWQGFDYKNSNILNEITYKLKTEK